MARNSRSDLFFSQRSRLGSTSPFRNRTVSFAELDTSEIDNERERLASERRRIELEIGRLQDQIEDCEVRQTRVQSHRFSSPNPSQRSRHSIPLFLDLSDDSHTEGTYSPGAYRDRSDTRQSDLSDSNRHLSSEDRECVVPISRREKEPEKFDGKSVDWKDFIVQFEYVADWNRWSYKEMAQQLVMCLRGTAQKLLGDLPSTQLTDYATLKTTLGNRFNPQERESAYRCEFRSRKRQKNETPSDYGYAIRRLGCLAFPDIPASSLEPFIIDQFTTGVGGPDLRKHITFRHPKTLDSAISLAVEYEAFDGCQGLRKPQVTFEDDPPKVDSIHKSSHQNDDVRALTKALEECTRRLTKLSEEIQANNNRARSPRPNYQNRSKYCQKCKTHDHNTNTCTKRDNSRSDASPSPTKPKIQNSGN